MHGASLHLPRALGSQSSAGRCRQAGRRAKARLAARLRCAPDTIQTAVEPDARGGPYPAGTDAPDRSANLTAPRGAGARAEPAGKPYAPGARSSLVGLDWMATASKCGTGECPCSLSRAPAACVGPVAGRPARSRRLTGESAFACLCWRRDAMPMLVGITKHFCWCWGGGAVKSRSV